jgi:hypothetical protein
VKGTRFKVKEARLKTRNRYRIDKNDILTVLVIDPAEEDGYTLNDPQKTMNEGFI